MPIDLPAPLDHQGWIDLCNLSDVPAESGLHVSCDDHVYAVFRAPDTAPDSAPDSTPDSSAPNGDADSKLDCGPSGNLNQKADAHQLHVLDDHCPHAGASLSAGYLDNQGCVVCPWHAWPFRLSDGACADNPAIKVNHYEAQVRDGRVWIRPAPEAPEADEAH